MTLWVFYLIGAVLALVWKCFAYCYIGVRRYGKPGGAAFVEWFEIETIDSKVSWIATVFIVWGIGAVFIARVNLDWTSAIFASLPAANWSAGLLGVLAEKAAPDIAKWLFCKFPGTGSGADNSGNNRDRR